MHAGKVQISRMGYLLRNCICKFHREPLRIPALSYEGFSQQTVLQITTVKSDFLVVVVTAAAHWYISKQKEVTVESAHDSDARGVAKGLITSSQEWQGYPVQSSLEMITKACCKTPFSC